MRMGVSGDENKRKTRTNLFHHHHHLLLRIIIIVIIIIIISSSSCIISINIISFYCHPHFYAIMMVIIDRWKSEFI